jgi:drug/metabolite transporter (DMT)-like permease
LYARFVGGERVRRRIWLGLGLSLAGLCLVAQIWAGLALDGIGVLAGLGAAASLATYFLMGERSVSDTPPLLVLTEAFVVASLFWNAIAPVSGLWRTGLLTRADFTGNLAGVHAPLWMLLLWMVLLGTVVPFVAELSALQHLTATEATLVGMLEPVGATIVGWLWFRQSLSAAQSIGVLAILLGIGLAQTARRGRPATDARIPGV